MTDADPDTLFFLVRSAREYTRGGWVFTGFHWPVLAGQVAARLAPDSFAQIFEAGATAHGPADRLPTSTTDYHALGSSLAWIGATSSVFPALVRRADRVVLDAANVDLRGCVNSTAIGPYATPRVRLPGGGGAADAAGSARELVLLHGGSDPGRIVARVEHVTAAPAPNATIRLLTRWGTFRLDGTPRLVESVGELPGELRSLGIVADGAGEAAPPSRQELAAASGVLHEAADRGYVVARAAVAPR